MKEIFQEYGGILITVVAILAGSLSLQQLWERIQADRSEVRFRHW